MIICDICGQEAGRGRGQLWQTHSAGPNKERTSTILTLEIDLCDNCMVKWKEKITGNSDRTGRALKKLVKDIFTTDGTILP